MNFKGVVFVTLLVVATGSIAARAVIGGGEDASQATSGGKAGVEHALKDGGTSTPSGKDGFGIDLGIPKPKDGGKTGGTTGGTTGTPSGDSDAAVPESAPGESDNPLADALPMLTEGSFFALIGFALGYFSRKVVKVLLFVLGGFFILVQGLSYLDVVSVDWDKALDVVNGFILNLKENNSVWEVLKDRIPTAGALVTGYVLGYRKG